MEPKENPADRNGPKRTPLQSFSTLSGNVSTMFEWGAHQYGGHQEGVVDGSDEHAVSPKSREALSPPRSRRASGSPINGLIGPRIPAVSGDATVPPRPDTSSGLLGRRNTVPLLYLPNFNLPDRHTSSAVDNPRSSDIVTYSSRSPQVRIASPANIVLPSTATNLSATINSKDYHTLSTSRHHLAPDSDARSRTRLARVSSLSPVPFALPFASSALQRRRMSAPFGLGLNSLQEEQSPKCNPGPTFETDEEGEKEADTEGGNYHPDMLEPEKRGKRRKEKEGEVTATDEDVPKPIPSVVGPNDLPYARCPSGIDAFILPDGEDPYIFVFTEDAKLAHQHSPPRARSSTYPDRGPSRVSPASRSPILSTLPPPGTAPSGGHTVYSVLRAKDRASLLADCEGSRRRARMGNEQRVAVEQTLAVKSPKSTRTRDNRSAHFKPGRDRDSISKAAEPSRPILGQSSNSRARDGAGSAESYLAGVQSASNMHIQSLLRPAAPSFRTRFEEELPRQSSVSKIQSVNGFPDRSNVSRTPRSVRDHVGVDVRRAAHLHANGSQVRFTDPWACVGADVFVPDSLPASDPSTSYLPQDRLPPLSVKASSALRSGARVTLSPMIEEPQYFGPLFASTDTSASTNDATTSPTRRASFDPRGRRPTELERAEVQLLRINRAQSLDDGLLIDPAVLAYVPAASKVASHTPLTTQQGQPSIGSFSGQVHQPTLARSAGAEQQRSDSTATVSQPMSNSEHGSRKNSGVYAPPHRRRSQEPMRLHADETQTIMSIKDLIKTLPPKPSALRPKLANAPTATERAAETTKTLKDRLASPIKGRTVPDGTNPVVVPNQKPKAKGRQQRQTDFVRADTEIEARESPSGRSPLTSRSKGSSRRAQKPGTANAVGGLR